MTGQNYFFYIGKNNKIKTATMNPINTAGSASKFFGRKGIDNYWEVNHDDAQSKLKALTSAISKGVNTQSVYSILERSDIRYGDIVTFTKSEDIEVKEIGDRYEVGDGKVTETAGSAISALLAFFAPDVETDTSNDEEE